MDKKIAPMLAQANLELKRGKYGEAQALAQQVLKSHPENFPAHQIAGLSAYKSGQATLALSHFNQVVSLSNGHISAMTTRSAIALAAGQPELAISDATYVVNKSPQSSHGWMNLGLANAYLQNWQAALDSFEHAMRITPSDIRPQIESCICKLHLNTLSAKEIPHPTNLSDYPNGLPDWSRLLKAATQTTPEISATISQHVWSGLNRAQAIEQAMQWAQLNRDLGLYTLARKYAQELSQNSDKSTSTKALLLQASIALELGDPELSCQHYEQLLKIAPEFWQAHSNYLIALQHTPKVSQKEINDAHHSWQQEHTYTPHARLPHRAKSNSNTKWRFFWITPRVCEGPTATFFIETLKKLPRDNSEHWLVQTHSFSDHKTAEFIQAADRYIDASQWNDDTLVNKLRAMQPDVAIDLAGHSPYHRLACFAQRIAPMQVSWLDYFNPTGIAAIDYFISDQVISPEYDNNQIILPRGRLAYSPPFAEPPISVTSSPAVRLGCFNRAAKLNDKVLETWATILRKLPNATLTLKNSSLQHREYREFITARAQDFGIEHNRLNLLEFSNYADTLDAYNNLDIALDTFPFSGCATSCDALWMGIPVITLRGSTHVSRQTCSILSHANLEKWIASDLDSYVSKTVELGLRVEEIRTNRTYVHEQFMCATGNTDEFAMDLHSRLIERLTD